MASDLHSRYESDTATVWERDGVDSAGDPTFSSASPRQINVRWEEQATTFVNEDGEEQNASGFVIVGEDLAPGDFLYLGTSAEADPANQSGAVRVLGFKKTRSPSNRFVSRVAYLSFRRTV